MSATMSSTLSGTMLHCSPWGKKTYYYISKLLCEMYNALHIIMHKMTCKISPPEKTGMLSACVICVDAINYKVMSPQLPLDAARGQQLLCQFLQSSWILR